MKASFFALSAIVALVAANPVAEASAEAQRWGYGGRYGGYGGRYGGYGGGYGYGGGWRGGYGYGRGGRGGRYWRAEADAADEPAPEAPAQA